MSYTIRGQTFATRRAVATYCAAMLQHGELSKEGEAFVRALLKGHPRHKQIVGPGIARIVVGTNGFGDASFIVVRTDGIRQPLAHVSCIAAFEDDDGTPEAA